MKPTRMLALAFGISLFAASAAEAAVLIDSGSYALGENVFTSGTVPLGPGAYRFTLDFTGPVDLITGFVSKSSVYNEYYQDSGQGGDDVPTIPLLEQTAPNRFQASLKVDKPYTILTPDEFIVKREGFDICCHYEVGFAALGAGEFALSYQALPEPATWMLMIFGFGAIGHTMRKARRKAGQRVRVAYA
jgi:hypothetical protein